MELEIRAFRWFKKSKNAVYIDCQAYCGIVVTSDHNKSCDGPPTRHLRPALHFLRRRDMTKKLFQIQIYGGKEKIVKIQKMKISIQSKVVS